MLVVVIDECRWVSGEGTSPNQRTTELLRQHNDSLKVLGLIFGPYCLAMGRIYRCQYRGFVLSRQDKSFQHCIDQPNRDILTLTDFRITKR